MNSIAGKKIEKFILLLLFMTFALHNFLAQETEDHLKHISCKKSSSDSLYICIEQAVTHVLTYYPNLKEVDVQFVFKKLNGSMEARPKYGSLIRSRKKRSYHVFVNIDKSSTGVLISDMNPDQRIGLIGHEFAHILDYSTKSSFRLIWEGMKYILSKKFRRKFERETDLRTIENGLGAELEQFSIFIHTDTNITHHYRKRLEEFYMTTDEITSCKKKKKGKRK